MEASTKAAESADKAQEPKTLNEYEKLAAIDVSDRIEKKQGLSYLSWAWALDQMLRLDPDASWTYPEPQTFPDGTVMVFCEVTFLGRTRRAHLPVIDHKNKPIVSPSSFALNTSMQRVLVKAIALHGLGLYIYAGEDLPYEEDGISREEQDKHAQELSKNPPKSTGPQKTDPINPNAYAAMQKELKDVKTLDELSATWKRIDNWIEANARPTEEQKTTLDGLYHAARARLRKDDLEDEIPF